MGLDEANTENERVAHSSLFMLLLKPSPVVMMWL